MHLNQNIAYFLFKIFAYTIHKPGQKDFQK